MRVFLIGGTGQIGLETARVLCARGHEVSAIARAPLPRGITLPKGMTLREGDYGALTEQQLAHWMTGCEGLVIAAGFNEGFSSPAPALEAYAKADIAPLRRLLAAAQACGVRRAALAGSYYAYFVRIWPEMDLETHPYIKGCVEQENLALAFSDSAMQVSVAELPPVVGGGRWSEPVLLPFVREVQEDEKRTFVYKGGTALVTVRQAAQAMAGALERGRGGRAYPVGGHNVQWTDLVRMIHTLQQTPEKKIKPLAPRAFQARMKQREAELAAGNREGGLDPVGMIPFRGAEAFIDRRIASDFLGVEESSLEEALEQTLRRCRELTETTQPGEK